MGLAISFRDAVFLAGRFPLLAGVTLLVDDGEVVHLRGANGAGKTSLLRACAGLLPLTSGAAEVLGHDLSLDRATLRCDVGLLGHATFLYDDLSVEENLRFAVRAARRPTDAIAPAMDRLGLAERLSRTPVAKLSTGQRRRVALAVLLARRPRLWLLDEPHAGLDEAGREVVDDIVAELRAAGSTVLIASHELERAQAIADRVVTVAGGQAHVEAPEGAVGPPGASAPVRVVPRHLPEVGCDVA